MLDLLVTFVYFRQDPASRTLARFHLALFRRDNPGALVVPLVYGCKAFLPGTVDAAELPGRFLDPADGGALWLHNDRIHLAYLFHAAPPARRYALFEWDTFSADMDLRTWYGDAWDADFAACHIFDRVEGPGWPWWGGVGDFGHPTAGVPFNGTLLSARAVECLKRGIPAILDHAFCEARVASTCRSLGLEMVEFRDRMHANRPNVAVINEETPAGIYHQVKQWQPRHGLELARGIL